MLLALQICVEGISKRSTGVIKSQLLINTLNFLQIRSLQLEITFQIRLDARWSLRFGKDGVVLGNTPSKCDLSAGLVVFLSNFDKDGVILLAS